MAGSCWFPRLRLSGLGHSCRGATLLGVSCYPAGTENGRLHSAARLFCLQSGSPPHASGAEDSHCERIGVVKTFNLVVAAGTIC
jgi:hypothetical protein